MQHPLPNARQQITTHSAAQDKAHVLKCFMSEVCTWGGQDLSSASQKAKCRVWSMLHSPLDQGPLPKPHGDSTVQFFSAGCFQLPGDNCRLCHVAASVFRAGLESLPHLNLSGKKSPLSPQDSLYKSGPPQIATTPVTCLETSVHP